MEPVPFIIASAVAIALVGAVCALWRRAIVTDRRNEAREKSAADRCEREIGAAVERIRFLEDRAHNEQQEMLSAAMATIQANAHAFERLVDLEQARQNASGAHPTVKAPT